MCVCGCGYACVCSMLSCAQSMLRKAQNHWAANKARPGQGTVPTLTQTNCGDMWSPEKAKVKSFNKTLAESVPFD